MRLPHEKDERAKRSLEKQKRQEYQKERLISTKRNEREKDEAFKRYLEDQKRKEYQKERLIIPSLDKRVSDYFATLPETHPVKQVGYWVFMAVVVIGFIVIAIIVIAVMLHNGSCQVDGDYSSCYP